MRGGTASRSAAIAGFVGFAFCQGAKVKSDNDNTDRWDRFGGPPGSDSAS